jgi:hypothetical protein
VLQSAIPLAATWHVRQIAAPSKAKARAAKAKQAKASKQAKQQKQASCTAKHLQR